MASGILMVRKTGGFITDKEGNNITPQKNIIAGNEHIRTKLEKTPQKKYLTLTVFYKNLRTLKNHVEREF